MKCQYHTGAYAAGPQLPGGPANTVMRHMVRVPGLGPPQRGGPVAECCPAQHLYDTGKGPCFDPTPYPEGLGLKKEIFNS